MDQCASHLQIMRRTLLMCVAPTEHATHIASKGIQHITKRTSASPLRRVPLSSPSLSFSNPKTSLSPSPSPSPTLNHRSLSLPPKNFNLNSSASRRYCCSLFPSSALSFSLLVAAIVAVRCIVVVRCCSRSHHKKTAPPI